MQPQEAFMKRAIWTLLLTPLFILYGSPAHAEVSVRLGFGEGYYGGYYGHGYRGWDHDRWRHGYRYGVVAPIVVAPYANPYYVPAPVAYAPAPVYTTPA